jgi:glycosyltransferase involved in cell wall biosynthesis
VRVGLLTTSFPRRAGDVPGQFVLGFAQALAAAGHTLSVLAPEPAEALPPARFAAIDLHWVRYLKPRALERTFYGAGVLDNLTHAPWTALGLAPFVLALFRAAHRESTRWDAVVSHWALPCALVADALPARRGRGARSAPLRHLAVLHSADVFLLERLPYAGEIARRIATGADQLLFVSRDLRARFLALLAPLLRGEVASRAHVCAMGIDPAPSPRPVRAALRQRLDLSGLCVLSMGRLISLKGVAHAIDALATQPETTLIIAGDGPMQAELRARARPFGARVRFVGELAGSAKTDWLSAVDAFVLPSIVLANGRSEGMPSVLLEAMEHGLPVIASDVGGVRDVVRPDENGFLLPPADAHAIARALSSLQDEALRARLGAGAQALAAAYHWPALAPQLSALVTGADFP